jgi:hypothetical protein
LVSHLFEIGRKEWGFEGLSNPLKSTSENLPVPDQHHRAIKRRTQPMLRFKNFRCVRVLLDRISIPHHIETCSPCNRYRDKARVESLWVAFPACGVGWLETGCLGKRGSYPAACCGELDSLLPRVLNVQVGDVGGNYCAATSATSHEAAASRFLERAIDRVDMKSKVIGKRALGRQPVPTLEDSSANRLLDLRRDGQIDPPSNAGKVRTPFAPGRARTRRPTRRLCLKTIHRYLLRIAIDTVGGFIQI